MSEAESSEVAQPAEAIDLSAALPKIADWLPESVQPAWDLIVALPIVGGLVIAVVFYFAAFAFQVLSEKGPDPALWFFSHS